METWDSEEETTAAVAQDSRYTDDRVYHDAALKGLESDVAGAVTDWSNEEVNEPFDNTAAVEHDYNLVQQGTNEEVDKKIMDNKEERTYINNRKLSVNAETYELETFEKNAMIIINQMHAKGCDPRVGTDKDVEALVRTFSKLRFVDIEVKTDGGKRDIDSEIDKWINRDFSDYGCVVIAILTHGEEGGRLVATDAYYKELDIIEKFKVSKNPSLDTKPKIFFIQACRGPDSLVGIAAGKSPQMGVFKYDTRMQHYYSLQVEFDVLVMHCSFPGKRAHRTINGSWFIQTLCRTIEELAKSQDLETILVEVKRRVAIELNHVITLDVTEGPKEIIHKQMPVTTSTLVRELYLRPYNRSSRDAENAGGGD